MYTAMEHFLSVILVSAEVPSQDGVFNQDLDEYYDYYSDQTAFDAVSIHNR